MRTERLLVLVFVLLVAALLVVPMVFDAATTLRDVATTLDAQ